MRLRRPRDYAVALRDLARRRPREAEDYLDTHQAEWESLAAAEPHNAADILEAIDEEAAATLIVELGPDGAAEVLEEMNPEAAADVLEELIEDAGAEAAAALLEGMGAAEAADLVGELTDEVQDDVLAGISPEFAGEVRNLLAYAPDSAGGLMQTDLATLPTGITAGEAIEALRRLHETVEQMSYVYVVDHTGRLTGVVSFRDLVFARPGIGIDETMIREPVAVRTDTDREDVAELIQRYNLLAIPVVDHRGVLVGVVRFEEVLEAIQSEASEDIAVMVGAGVEESIYTPVGRSVRNRLPWLGVNLVLAFIIAAVISRFEDTISELAILAAYMPVVALVGGNGGAQSLAVVIRALAVEDIPAGRVRRVIAREVTVGALMGVAVAAAAGAIAGIATSSGRIALVIFIAAFGNLTIGGLAGSGIPILMRKLGFDPALASNIFLTAITDIIGFGGFLAIATLLL